MAQKQMIPGNYLPVSAAYLPAREELYHYLDRIYATGTVTNNGPLVRELEAKLREWWGVKHVFFVANGTWALQLAYRALGIRKGVLLTPFSAIPSLSSLQWEKIPVCFSDIHPGNFNLDPDRLPHDTEAFDAICATHVFGNPCQVDALSEYCSKHGLKLIFDAAHAAGSLWAENSVLQYGDISAISFHAFKIFHSVEGGAVITSNDEIAESIYRMRYFGLDSHMQFRTVGTNAKNSEWHAAMGLANLGHVCDLLEQRKTTYIEFHELLQHPALRFQEVQKGATPNYSYFPLVFQTEKMLLQIAQDLHNQGFMTKRYFHPALNSLVPAAAAMPVAEQLASTILCLPHHSGVTTEHRKQMAQIILKRVNA